MYAYQPFLALLGDEGIVTERDKSKVVLHSNENDFPL